MQTRRFPGSHLAIGSREIQILRRLAWPEGGKKSLKPVRLGSGDAYVVRGRGAGFHGTDLALHPIKAQRLKRLLLVDLNGAITCAGHKALIDLLLHPVFNDRAEPCAKAEEALKTATINDLSRILETHSDLAHILLDQDLACLWKFEPKVDRRALAMRHFEAAVLRATEGNQNDRALEMDREVIERSVEIPVAELPYIENSLTKALIPILRWFRLFPRPVHRADSASPAWHS